MTQGRSGPRSDSGGERLVRQERAGGWGELLVTMVITLGCLFLLDVFTDLPWIARVVFAIVISTVVNQVITRVRCRST